MRGRREACYRRAVATNKRLLRLAREQRANNVNAEAMLWRIVRDRRCAGHKFRRQMPLGDCIVDLVCLEQRLVVEIDGPSHASDEQRRRDEKRDAWLAANGFRVLRLTNELVIGAPELAEQRIVEALRANPSSVIASQ
jgi:very-short-patch-repair endonuclease